MTSDESEPSLPIYQLKLSAVLARALYYTVQARYPWKITKVKRETVPKSATDRRCDIAVAGAFYTLMTEDLMFARSRGNLIAWLHDVAITNGYLAWEHGELVGKRLPAIEECCTVVRSKWREATARGLTLMDLC